MAGLPPIMAKKPIQLRLSGLRKHSWSIVYRVGLLMLAPGKGVPWALARLRQVARDFVKSEPKLNSEPTAAEDLITVAHPETPTNQGVVPCAPPPALTPVAPVRPARRRATVIAHTPTGLPASDVRTKRSKAIRKSQGESEQLPTPYSALYADSNVNALRAAKSKSSTTKTVP